MGQVMTIIRMAQQSFRDQGVDQWQDGYPNEEVILEDIRKGQSYVAEEKGIILGTAVISFEKERSLYSLMIGIKPANLALWASRPLDKEEADCVRAAYIRERLPRMIESA